jgi:GTP cyclohydrolase IA
VSQALQLLWGELPPEMQKTPERVVKYWLEMSMGATVDPAEPLKTRFKSSNDELVLIKDIEVFSLCAHHLLPFHGVAHIAYIPNGEVVGLSKIPRALEILATRPQIQENLTVEMGELIERELTPIGTAVVIEASHTCMCTRGIRKPGATTVTSYMGGCFRSDHAARAEVLQLIKS